MQANATSHFERVTLDRIRTNPGQPRRSFDDEDMLQLSESIKNHGVLQPIVVRANGDGYQIIAGERRYRAAQVLGLAEVPVHVVDFNDRQTVEAALVENIQRADLNPVEKAQGFKEYCDRFGVSREELAVKLGMDKSTVVNLIAILNLPAEVQDAIRLNQITTGHAKALKALPTPAEQSAWCKEAMLKGMSVKALELAIRTVKAEKESAGKPAPAAKPSATDLRTPHVEAMENELRQKLATRVEIKLREKDKGEVVVHFECDDDFERILDVMRR